MKVVLLENVRKVGSIGEIIDVKRGFARNYLISKKKALFASKENIKQVEKLTNLHSSIGNVEWSYDDKHLLFNSFVEAKDDGFIEMPEKPEGAKWNAPPIEIDDMVYRYDGRGYRKSGNNQIFILPVEGGTPRQVSFLNKNSSSAIWLDSENILFCRYLIEILSILITNKIQKITDTDIKKFQT